MKTPSLKPSLTAAALLMIASAMSVTAATFTVRNTNDSGPGSLRQAILDADAASGTDTVVFLIGSAPMGAAATYTVTNTNDSYRRVRWSHRRSGRRSANG